MIEAHNQEEEEGLHTYTVGMNHFGDLVSLDIKNRNLFPLVKSKLQKHTGRSVLDILIRLS